MLKSVVKSALLASTILFGSFANQAFSQKNDEDDVVIIVSHGPAVPQLTLDLSYNQGPQTSPTLMEDLYASGDYRVFSQSRTHGMEPVSYDFYAYPSEETATDQKFGPGVFTFTLETVGGDVLSFEAQSKRTQEVDLGLEFVVNNFPGVQFAENVVKMVPGEKELEDGKIVQTERYYNYVTVENETLTPVTLLFIDQAGDNYEVIENFDESMAPEDGMICWWLYLEPGEKTTLKYAVEKWDIA